MKRHVRKTVFFSIILIFTVFLLGCQNEESTADESEEVVLTYSLWDSYQEPGMTAVADAFEEKHPNITVNVEVTPGSQYFSKMEAAALGGSLPDILWMDSQEFPKFAEAEDVFMDLTEWANENVALEKFPEELVDVYTTDDDRLLGMPKDYDTIALWYNKEIFDAAGIAYPDDTWTWDTLLEKAKQLTDQEKGVYGFLAPMVVQDGYRNLIYQNGGEVLLEDKKKSGYRMQETVNAVQWYIDLSVKHGVSPTASQFADNQKAVYFQSGRGAMAFFGSWLTGQMADNNYTSENADIAPLPKGKQPATIFNGLAHMVSATTEHPDEALLFLEFLSSEEGMRIQGESGAAIPALEGTDQYFVDAFPQFNTEVYTDQLKYGVIKPYSKLTKRWENTETTLLIPAFMGEQTVAEVADDIIVQVEAILTTE